MKESIFRNLFVGASLYTASNAVLGIAKLLLIPVYTHYLIPEQYGVLGAVNTMNIILIMVMSFGIERAVAREYFDYENDPAALRSYLITLLAFSGVLNIFVVAILTVSNFWLTGWWSSEIKIPYYPYVVIALAISSSTTFYSIFMVILQVKQMALPYVAAQVLRFLLIIGVTLTLLIGFDMGATAVLGAELVATATTTVTIIIFFRRKFLPAHIIETGVPLSTFTPDKKIGQNILAGLYYIGKMFDYQKLRKAMFYAFPLLVFELGGWVISGLDRLFLAKFCSLEEVGFYALGATLAQGLNVLTSSIQTAYLPFFFQTAKADPHPEIVFARVAGLYVLVIGFVCLIGMLFTSEIIRMIAPSTYEKSNVIMRILLLSTFFWSLYRLAVLPLLHLKETGHLIVFISLSMILSLAGNLWSIPHYGAVGAAWTNALCYGFLFILTFKVASKRFPIKYAVGSFWGVIVLIVGGGFLLYDQSIILRLSIFSGMITLAVFLNYRQGNFLIIRDRRV